MRKPVFYLLLLLAIHTSLHADKLEGQALLDSLLNVLPHTKADTTKVTLLTEISLTYRDIDPNKGLEYGMQALALAEKLKSRKWIGISYNMIGGNYENKSDLIRALDYFLKSLKISEELKDTLAQTALLHNIGGLYFSLEDYEKALGYLEVALKLNRIIGYKRWQMNNLIMFGNIYHMQRKDTLALTYYYQAKSIAEELKNNKALALILVNTGSTYNQLADYAPALEYASKSLTMYEEMGDTYGIGLCHSTLGTTYYQIASDSNKTFLGSHFGGNQKLVLLKAKEHLQKALAIDYELEGLYEISEDSKYLSETLFLLGDINGALENYKIHALFRDSVFNMEKEKKFTQTAMQYEFDKKEASAKAEQEKKDIRQKNIRNSIAAGLGGALIFLVVVYRQRNRIDKEKKRSEELLLNILPEEVAEELKSKGKAEAKHIDNVTVLFTDFKGFTQLSEKLTPKELVSEIDLCFRAFDHIIHKHGIEKIKTIGDSYMCAGGLPLPNNTHAYDVVSAARDIQQFMHQHKAEREAAGKLFFEIRIGIHSGPVVAGIVGLKKYSYDIWGDTVNIASRMESSGEAGKVNISGSTHELVKDKFTCTHRGKIPAKNKGEIDMYFVETIS